MSRTCQNMKVSSKVKSSQATTARLRPLIFHILIQVSVTYTICNINKIYNVFCYCNVLKMWPKKRKQRFTICFQIKIQQQTLTVRSAPCAASSAHTLTPSFSYSKVQPVSEARSFFSASKSESSATRASPRAHPAPPIRARTSQRDANGELPPLVPLPRLRQSMARACAAPQPPF